VDRGNKGVCAIAKDGKEEGGGKPVVEEAGEANPRRGEMLNRHEGCLGFGQPFDEVGGGGGLEREPIAQPPDLTLWRENRPSQVDRSIRDGVPIPIRAPVDKFRLGD